MFMVETYAAVRRFVLMNGGSQREAARVFGLSRETMAKMCRYSAPPGHVRSKPAGKPKLGALLGVIEATLEADRGRVPRRFRMPLVIDLHSQGRTDLAPRQLGR
jgi:hypothetical protein